MCSFFYLQIVPKAELDAALELGTRLRPTEVVVRFFDDNRFAMVHPSYLRPFLPLGEPFKTFQRDPGFLENPAIRKALVFLNGGTIDSSFRWVNWGKSGLYSVAAGDRVTTLGSRVPATEETVSGQGAAKPAAKNTGEKAASEKVKILPIGAEVTPKSSPASRRKSLPGAPTPVVHSGERAPKPIIIRRRGPAVVAASVVEQGNGFTTVTPRVEDKGKGAAVVAAPFIDQGKIVPPRFKDMEKGAAVAIAPVIDTGKGPIVMSPPVVDKGKGPAAVAATVVAEEKGPAAVAVTVVDEGNGSTSATPRVDEGTGLAVASAPILDKGKGPLITTTPVVDKRKGPATSVADEGDGFTIVTRRVADTGKGPALEASRVDKGKGLAIVIAPTIVKGKDVALPPARVMDKGKGPAIATEPAMEPGDSVSATEPIDQSKGRPAAAPITTTTTGLPSRPPRSPKRAPPPMDPNVVIHMTRGQSSKAGGLVPFAVPAISKKPAGYHYPHYAYPARHLPAETDQPRLPSASSRLPIPADGPFPIDNPIVDKETAALLPQEKIEKMIADDQNKVAALFAAVQPLQRLLKRLRKTSKNNIRAHRATVEDIVAARQVAVAVAKEQGVDIEAGTRAIKKERRARHLADRAAGRVSDNSIHTPKVTKKRKSPATKFARAPPAKKQKKAPVRKGSSSKIASKSEADPAPAVGKKGAVGKTIVSAAHAENSKNGGTAKAVQVAAPARRGRPPKTAVTDLPAAPAKKRTTASSAASASTARAPVANPASSSASSSSPIVAAPTRKRGRDAADDTAATAGPATRKRARAAEEHPTAQMVTRKRSRTNATASTTATSDLDAASLSSLTTTSGTGAASSSSPTTTSGPTPRGSSSPLKRGAPEDDDAAPEPEKRQRNDDGFIAKPAITKPVSRKGRSF
ncbi:hypothetical protein BDK51DRAFT_46581 [Blyttiomyces helicus]|uniref:PWWP domain-containing protein n=1 Tax=Blyttiomyces helicus TaxID=388810 RepID=A0A4P9W1D1_9FUNG|nr:hypothetical protein BDK51DRAFT_46581 [Blyttiomyces helicus]|eukprot:RKO85462.1 hypothetical protein BDK51DRAFT_46581 [Blyttiomyces helicus]